MVIKFLRNPYLVFITLLGIFIIFNHFQQNRINKLKTDLEIARNNEKT